MSKQIHSGESQRRKQVKFRASEQLVEAFDETIDGSRSDALRELMQEKIAEPSGDLDEPDDNELARAYRWLVGHQGDSGTVSERRAKKKIAERTGYDRDEVRRFVLAPLEQRGYVHIRDPPPGVQSDGAVKVHVHRREA